MLLACQNIKKAFGSDTILENVSFLMEEREKVAIIGVNGAGKSTLFKIITGELPLDDGQVVLGKEKSLGYMAQLINNDRKHSIYDEVLMVFEPLISMQKQIHEIEKTMGELQGEELEKAMENYSKLRSEFENKDGYAYESRVRGVLKGLGFTENDFTRNVNQLSGGEQTRVSLSKLLLTAPDLLLLDEPTNHLDINSIEWLEDYLKNFKSAVIIISHDRYFIDKVSNKIIEIENGKSAVYNGDYKHYAKKKTEIREQQYKQYIDQQRYIKKQEDSIEKLKSYNREKSVKRAESKMKRLDMVEKLDKPENLPDKLRFSIEPRTVSGNDVLDIVDLEKSFDGKKLFRNITFYLKKGEKYALIGPNGVGKTTIFKILLEEMKADAGEFKFGSNVNIAYYDQKHSNIDDELSILDNVSNAHPKLTTGEIRNTLAAFNFYGDDVFKKVKTLSGGEKGRVSLARLMLTGANLLLLDEPTNHLDMYSKEVLEEALKKYTGTIFVISHDRYFINNVVNNIYELKSNGVNKHLGNYDWYLEHKQEDITYENTEVIKSENVSTSKQDWIKNKESQAIERKKKSDLRKTEDKISKFEELISELDEKLLTDEISSDHVKATEIFNEKSKIEGELQELYQLWESLAD